MLHMQHSLTYTSGYIAYVHVHEIKGIEITSTEN